MEPEQALITARELQLELSSAAPVLFHGYSMWPFLTEGDSLVVTPVRFEEIKVGDIVTCRGADKFPTYRVITKLPGSLVLAGDNWPDAMVEAPGADVLGRVVARERGGNWLRRESWRWRLLALLRTSRGARRCRHPLTRVVRALLGYEAARQTG